MKYYNIAGLNVAMHFCGETLKKQAKPYELKEKPKQTDMEIDPKVDDILSLMRANPSADANVCEYMWTGTEFYEKLLDYDGFMLHSSAVELDGKAYLFSAASGTGKSTHTGLWLKVFGNRAQILNDDKPAIRVIDGITYACGTPWSGKSDLSVNEKVPVQGICFLERAEKNHISEISVKEALPLLFEQTIKLKNKEKTDKMFESLEKVFFNTRMYKMGCNISDEAAVKAYEKMREGEEK